jgi:serine/threonine protein kinase
MPSHDLYLSTGTRLGPYTIISAPSKPNHVGGNSQIYKAQLRASDGTSAEYAVKLLDPAKIRGYGEDKTRRRQERLEAICRIQHPNIARLYTHGEIVLAGVKTFFQVMEYVNGPNLLASIQQRTHDPATVPFLVAQIARGISQLEHHLIHIRDLKTSNIGLATHQIAKLLDFDIIYPFTSDAPSVTTDGEQYEGYTTRYAPPEVFRPRLTPADPECKARASHIYQMGLVLHDLLMRVEPYHGMPEDQIREMITEGRPPKVESDLFPDLAETARRMLAIEPDERLKSFPDYTLLCAAPLRPTIVLLYGGGTIGATRDADGRMAVHRYESRHDSELQDLAQLLLRERAHNFAVGERMPLEFDWELLPVDHQILSENAREEYWAQLSQAIRTIHDKYVSPGLHRLSRPSGPDNKSFTNAYESECSQRSGQGYPREAFAWDQEQRYLLGVIVLCGTDTMSYIAPGLAFGLRNLTFPVVITGGNKSLLPDGWLRMSAHQRVTQLRRSDAWTNMLTCVDFLESFGHRYTEIFVCFDSTVHHALNLRKTPREGLVFGTIESHARTGDEPFRFRNLAVFHQFMFKEIDGVWCNNYYPIGTIRHGLSQELPRHFRTKWIGGEGQEAPGSIYRKDVRRSVRHVIMSPGFWLVENALDVSGPRVIVVEAYDSGTLSSDAKSDFRRLLTDCLMNGTPIAVVTRYGLNRGGAVYADDFDDNVRDLFVPLYDVIAETAIPLVTAVLEEVTEKDWRDSFQERGAAGRAQLFRNRMSAFFERWRSIIQLELGIVVDASDRRARKDSSPATEILVTEDSGRDRKVGSFMRRWASRHRQGFSVVGAGPEAFETFVNEGFYDGMEEASRSEPGGQTLDFDGLTERQRERELERMLVRSRTCLNALASAGIIIGINARATQVEWIDGALCVRAALRRLHRQDVEKQLFAVTLRRDEMSLKELLARRICGEQMAEWVSEKRQWLETRIGQMWSMNCADVDWYILGFVKGMLVEFVKHAGTDKIALDAKQEQRYPLEVNHWLLRRSIEVMELSARARELRVRVIYKGIESGLAGSWRIE